MGGLRAMERSKDIFIYFNDGFPKVLCEINMIIGLRLLRIINYLYFPLGI